MTIPEGAIDIHVHAGPSYFARKYDAIELARDIADSPMGGAVFKSHFGTTNIHTELANKYVEDTRVYSATVLNSFVGGFNPVAVEYAIGTYSRIIWLPTFSAANFNVARTGRDFPFSNQSLTTIDETGDLKPTVRDLLERIADAERPVTLANGHISREETFAVFDAIEEMGLDIPYFITHADSAFMDLSQQDQITLADRGAYIGKCYLATRNLPVPDMAKSIEDIGPAHCVLTTDHGQPSNPSPVEALDTFVTRLRAAGVTDGAITHMAVSNPRSLVGECE